MNIGKYLDLYSEDMTLKNYSEKTIKNYKNQLSLFLRNFCNSATKPSEINESQIKEWLLQSKTVNTLRIRHSAIKFFYNTTIGQPLKMKRIPYPRPDKKLPIVLSQDEIQRMFDVCQNLKHKTILALLYSCGIRVSELINLQWSHIDRSRMVINIVAGKGRKDRQVMLDESLVKLLIAYFKEYRSEKYVLNGQGNLQYSTASVRQVIVELAKKAKIRKRVYVHLIRHCAFTHMTENGTDINLIQRIAGHSSVKTTNLYLHISDSHISKIQSPLKAININQKS